MYLCFKFGFWHVSIEFYIERSSNRGPKKPMIDLHMVKMRGLSVTKNILQTAGL